MSENEEISEDEISKQKEQKRKEEILECFNFNCFICRGIDCFDLKPPHPKDPNVMGDLYFGNFLCEKVHQKDNEDNLDDLLCTNYSLFKAVCFIVNSVPEKADNIILREILFHSARDLKASIFLATAGYYRNSMQVLRCSFETLLFGLYYYTDFRNVSNNETRKKAILKSYSQWKKGGVIKRIDVMNEIYRRMGLITKDEETKWNKLYAALSKYIHTPKSTWGKKINEAGITEQINCMAYNVYDLSDFTIWSDNFRNVYLILIKVCLYFEPALLEKKGGKAALKVFKEEYSNLKEYDLLKELINKDVAS